MDAVELTYAEIDKYEYKRRHAELRADTKEQEDLDLAINTLTILVNKLERE